MANISEQVDACGERCHELSKEFDDLFVLVLELEIGYVVDSPNPGLDVCDMLVTVSYQI